MPGALEKQLDAALDDAFRTDAEFVNWFVSNTRFAGLVTRYLWSRSDNPWGSIDNEATDP